MDGNKGPDRKNLVGGALLLAALAVAAAGALISLRTGSSDVFMWMSIPAAILIVSGGAVISGKALPGADRLLLANGEYTVTAEVLGVTRNLRTKGEKTEYYIVCRCKDPRTGKEETYSSRPLETYPGREVIGKKVEVHLDAGEKGKYTVDIEPLLKEVEAERKKNSMSRNPMSRNPMSRNPMSKNPMSKNPMSKNPMSKKPMSENSMSRQNEWIERMIQRAEADEPVYITDIREMFDRYGERAFHIHAFLYEGGRERFPLSLPEWENDRQRSFTAEYVRAFLYNLLSTLGALKIEIYLDTEDGELVSLAEGLEDDFQVNCRKEERTGYGKSLNVNERTIKALRGDRDRFSIVIRDIAEEEIPARTAECESGSDVFAGLPAAAAESFLLGIDVGGTDIKFAVSRAGRLVHFEELDWAPASFQEVSLLTQPVMNAAERLMKEFGDGRKWDAIGLSWPDVIIRNMIVGGETTKTKGLRENTQRDYEEQFSELTGLCGRLKEYVRDGGAVMCTNDGVMAAFTDAVEMAAAGEDVSKGFFAYSLGTELGTGWIRADGSVPQIPLEVYNCIIDLGSCRARTYQPEDVRSCRNVNTLLPGSLQKYTGQSGVFRLAAKQLPEKEPALYREALERGLFEVKGAGELIIVPTEPEDMRKDCLEFFMEKAALGESEVCRDVFRTIGEYIAVTWAENEYLLHPQAKERTLFGRLVKRSECFELIKEGAEKKEPSLVLRNADADLAVTPLMKQLAEDPVYTVAQFAQAVGALYFGCLGLCSSQDTR